MTNLSSYPISVGTELYVHLDIPGAELYLSDGDFSRTIAGNSYSTLGSLMGVSASISSIRATNYSMAIGISGIPTSSIDAAFDDDAKGSPVIVRRGYTDPVTRALIGDPVIKFTGIIDNVGFSESYDGEFSTFQIVFNAISRLNFLQSRVAGRKTNLQSQQNYFPSDTAFRRVASIRNSNFNFGSPNPQPTYGTSR